MKDQVYQIVTDRIVEALRKGVVPWRKPWRTGIGPDGVAYGPKNLVSKHAYRGVNIFTLMATGYGSDYWLTFNQARTLGGCVRKGEKASPVIFWKFLDVIDKQTQKKDRIPLLRYFSVFNTDQCDGLADAIPKPAPVEPKTEAQKIESAEAVVKAYEGCPPITYGGDAAAYSPGIDRIKMPVRETFESPEHFYSTLFHEMTHSTGHESRLDRRMIGKAAWGSGDYGREELVAECGAAFLTAEAGIDIPAVRENEAAYLGHWMEAINGDPRMVVVAAGAAQRASDWIMGRRPKAEAKAEPEIDVSGEAAE